MAKKKNPAKFLMLHLLKIKLDGLMHKDNLQWPKGKLL